MAAISAAAAFLIAKQLTKKKHDSSTESTDKTQVHTTGWQVKPCDIEHLQTASFITALPCRNQKVVTMRAKISRLRLLEPDKQSQCKRLLASWMHQALPSEGHAYYQSVAAC